MFLTLLFLSLVVPILSFTENCDPGDRDALLTFKNSLSNPEILHSWNASKNCCGWNGVHCDGTNYVSRLQLTDNLKGEINPSIANLKRVSNIVLSGMPNLVGEIPLAITRMKNLGVLIISGTGISGPVPESLSNLKKLSALLLTDNKLSGPIPASLINLPILNGIDLSNNQLTGTIPESFGHFSPDMYPLMSINLANNKLSGKIPASFAGARFNSLDISGNNLYGDASLLFTGKNKEGSNAINIARNNFAFNLSEVTFPTSLSILDISQNMIYGGIPQQITETSLIEVNVSYNQLCGQIPTGWKSALEPYNTWDASSFQNNKCLCGAPLAPCK